MKAGRKPSYNERKILEANGLDAREWLIIKIKAKSIELRHREKGNTIEIPKN